MISNQEIHRLKNAAVEADKVERYWRSKFRVAIEKYEEKIFQAVVNGMSLDYIDIDFSEISIRHAVSSMRHGIAVCNSERELHGKADKQVRLARKSGLPTTMRELREWYDAVRRGEKVPLRIKKNAATIKNLYLKKCQSLWDKYSENFRSGNAMNQDEVRRQIRNAASITSSRANTIVATETTRYYNDVREKYYDGVASHFLFLAIRDSRTTEWCQDRHGLVYKAGSEYLKRENAPCHWSCRSEIVPLVPFNPNHKKLIENKSLWRENNKCKPLPENWSR